MIPPNNPQRLHLLDVTRLEFDAHVVESFRLPDGRPAVVLDQTYFYATAGGQEHDTGSLGSAQVLDVFKAPAAGTTIHVLDRDLPPGPLTGRIDAGRRLRNMQHHTAQHLLSQCFLRLGDIDSLSANINGYSPSTLDVAAADLTRADLDKVEDMAQSVIYADLPVKSYFVTPEELADLPVRWPPAVSENIRVVEIEGYDYTPCGGTHVTRTGMIGVLKILKTERLPEGTRLHFVAGHQAFELLRGYQEIVQGLAAQFSVHPQELAAAVQRQAAQLQAMERELVRRRSEQLAAEGAALAANAAPFARGRLALAAWEDRPATEVRGLVEAFKTTPDLVAVLANWAGGKLSLIVYCGPQTGLPAPALLTRLLEPFGGRGGGSPQLAQGGGPASREQFDLFLPAARAVIESL